MSNETSSKRYGSRGVATVEAVVALPVLVLLFVAIFFFRDLAGARHETATRARSCAWLYSASNCRDVPPGCESVLTDTTAVGDSRISIPQLGGSKEGAQGADRMVSGLLEKALITLLGAGVKAHATKEVRRVPLFGGGTLEVSNDYHLACNLANTTPEQVVKDAWDIWSPL